MDRSADNLGQVISGIQRDLEELKSSQGSGSGGGGGGGGEEYYAGDGITISNNTISADTNVLATKTDLTDYAELSDLATVATSGSYNDLTNKPTIPAAQVNSDWNASSGVAEILNKPNLATVATSGSYNDLSNKPTIPTVNNGTLTIQKNGTTVQTFTANQSTAATANISVPTKTSDLANDAGFVSYSGNICGSGKSISLSAPFNAPLASSQLDGETSQNGTPTPSAPVAVSTTTGENVVYITGKNIYDSSRDSTGGYLDSSGAFVSAGNWHASGYIGVKAGEQYTISGITTPGQSPKGCYYNSARQFVSSFNNGNQTITIPSGVCYVRLSIFNGIGGDNVPRYDSTTLQFELGSTATAYEPYQGQSYPISLGSIELCKIGDYQDYIYKDGSDWKIHKAIGTATVDASVEKTWVRSGQSTSAVFVAAWTNMLSGGFIHTIDDRLFAQNFSYSNATAVNTARFNKNVGSTEYDYMLIRFDANTFDTIGKVKTWLNNNPQTVYYQLTTPTDTEITNEALIAQLDALLTTARTYAGTNNIFTITPNEQGTLEMCFEGGVASAQLMGGCTSTTNGFPGLVPAPAAGDQEKYLRGDGTWQPAGSSSDIPDGTVTTPKLASKAVTTAKIDDGAVTNAQIANSTIAATKINWSTFKYNFTATTDGAGFIVVPTDVVNKSTGFILSARCPGSRYAFAFVFSDADTNSNRYTLCIKSWDMSNITNQSVEVDILYCLA